MQRQQRKSKLSSMLFHLINKLPLNLSIHPQDGGAQHPLTYFVSGCLYICMLFMSSLLPPGSPPLIIIIIIFFFRSVTVFKICPDSQLCNSVNDGCRCCWSAQVTTGQKNESNRCCWQWDLYSDTATSLPSHIRTSGSRTDGYACLQMLSLFYFYPFPTSYWVSVNEN